jgi:hypothetical protein
MIRTMTGIDTGELKQLAALVTKKLGTVALLASVYDSDSFEFVMFHNGKQVDAAASDPENHAGGLKMLKGKRRAQAWHSMFIGRDFRRAVLAGRQEAAGRLGRAPEGAAQLDHSFR